MRIITTALLLLATGVASAAEISAEDLDRRRKALNDLLDEHWEYTLRTNPELASMVGDSRFNAEVSDQSEKAVLEDLAATRKFLKRFQVIDTAGFTETERLNRDLMIRNLQEKIDAEPFRLWLMPVSQFDGLHLFLPQFPSLITFDDAGDYRAYIVRLRKMPKQLDDLTARMRKGMRAGLMDPKFLLEQVAEQAEEIASGKPEESPFANPLENMPASIPAKEQAAIRKEFLEAIRSHALPAYAKFARFVREEYAPRGRKDVGIWSLADGAARYANAVHRHTTTNLTPERVHEIGLREVGRIEAEMLEIAKKLGYSDLRTFNAAIDRKPELRAKSRQHIVDLYKQYTAQMYEKLPELFGRLPKAKLEILPTEAFREESAAAADYNSGALDGSRPGRVNVNTFDATSRKIIVFESTAYHEGVPGHHMQTAIAQELTDLPKFRREGAYTAFDEGWALYSEQLGKEVGFYQDPYSDYGRLQDEMLRAIRLVVDTGLHAKRWTRDDVVKYFRDHSAIDEVDIQAETDRYIVWPGQALAYKLGSLKIAELRERSRIELGDKFDIRAFHDEVLGAGALPLSVLEERIDAWIARVKNARAS